MWMYFLLRLVELGAFVGMTAYWLHSMNLALSRIPRSVRSMEPEQVWLTFIPLFGLVWGFIINTRVSESLGREYRRRQWHSDEARPGFEIGAVTVTMACLYFVQYGFTWAIPFISFVCMVILCGAMYRHTARLNAFRERLDEAGPDEVSQLQPEVPPVMQQPVWPQQPGYPPQQWPSGYAQQPGYPTQQPGYAQQPGYPPQQPPVQQAPPDWIPPPGWVPPAAPQAPPAAENDTRWMPPERRPPTNS